MSYRDGWAALNLQFSPKIPRTEYSVCSYHWELMQQVTGIDTSCVENRPAAQLAFRRSWDYGFLWATRISRGELLEAGATPADMGHAVYGEDASGQGDFRPVTTNPYADPEQVYALDPAAQFRFFERSELIRKFEEHYREQQALVPDAVAMSGVYVTLFSGLIELLGWESLLLALGTDERRFNRLVDSYYHWIRQFFEAYAESSIPVMMVHDDLCWTSGPVTDPAWYRRVIFPRLKQLLEPVLAAGKRVMFTSDGRIDCFFRDLAELGIHSLVMEPCCDLEFFAREFGREVGFVGGVDCRTLMYGSRDEIRREVERAMRLGREYPGFMLAVGNHLPANVPVERALYYNELYEELAYR